MKIYNIDNEVIHEIEGDKLFRANLSKANFSEANLIGAILSGVDLSRANLSGAILSGVDLSKANLSKVNLSKANLSDANLIGATLRGADLTRAILDGADLTGSNLIGANLSEASFSRANLTNTKGIFSFTVEGHLGIVFKYDNTVYIKIGCKSDTADHWLENYKEIGKEYKYTNTQIKNYGTMIKTMTKMGETL